MKPLLGLGVAIMGAAIYYFFILKPVLDVIERAMRQLPFAR